MAKKDLLELGHFERVPDMDGQFRVVTAHEYPAGWIMQPFYPLTEKWEQGTLSELEKISERLRNSKPVAIHPATMSLAEDMADWKKEQGRTLKKAVADIRAELDKEREAEEFPLQEFGDPVI